MSKSQAGARFIAIQKSRDRRPLSIGDLATVAANVANRLRVHPLYADDVRSAALARLLEKRDYIDGADSPISMAYRIAYNRAKDELRKIARERRAVVPLEDAILQKAKDDGLPDAETALTQVGWRDDADRAADIRRAELEHARRIALREAVAALEPTQRRIIELSFWSGATAAKVAATLGLSEAWVKELKRAALDRLRVLLTEKADAAHITA